MSRTAPETERLITVLARCRVGASRSRTTLFLRDQGDGDMAWEYEDGTPYGLDVRYFSDVAGAIDYALGRGWQPEVADLPARAVSGLSLLGRTEMGILAWLWAELGAVLGDAPREAVEWTPRAEAYADQIRALTQALTFLPVEFAPPSLVHSGVYRALHADLGLDPPDDIGARP